MFDVLANLVSVNRFDMNLMFLSRKEKEGTQNL